MKKLAFVLALVSFSAFAQIAGTSPVPAGRKVCAVAFNSLDHHSSSKLNIPSGAAMPDLNREQMISGGNWDNRISKVAVAAGCTFIGYQYQDFNLHYNNGEELDGFALVLANDTQAKFKTTVLYTENEKISSIKCFCR